MAAAAERVWEASTLVRWAPGVLQQVRSQAIEGWLALPRRGVETGGLLLGTVTCLMPHEVLIEGICPISCEHKSGPSFRLSESDLAKLEELLAQTRSMGELCVVGYYRSRTARAGAPRVAPELDEQDQELIEAYFADPSHVFLSLRPWSLRECEGRLFSWRCEDLVPVSSVFEVGSALPELVENRAAPVTLPLPANPPQPEVRDEKPDVRPVVAPRTETPAPKRRNWLPQRLRLAQGAAVMLGVFGLLLTAVDRRNIEPAGDRLAPVPVAAAPVLPARSAPPPETSGRGVAPVHGPVALEEPQPDIPESIWNRVLEPLTVRVSVQVGADGRAVAAKPAAYSDGLHRYVAQQAADAARLVRYQPARTSSGAPVAGQVWLEVTIPPRS